MYSVFIVQTPTLAVSLLWHMPRRRTELKWFEPEDLRNRGVVTDPVFMDAFQSAVDAPGSSRSGNCRAALQNWVDSLRCLKGSAAALLSRTLAAYVQACRGAGQDIGWNTIKPATELSHPDYGNIPYTCMFQSLAAICDDWHAVVLELAAVWPTLHPCHPDESDHMYGMKGDIMEFLQNVWFHADEPEMAPLLHCGTKDPELAKRVYDAICKAGESFRTLRSAFDHPSQSTSLFGALDADVGLKLRDLGWPNRVPASVLARCFLCACSGFGTHPWKRRRMNLPLPVSAPRIPPGIPCAPLPTRPPPM